MLYHIVASSWEVCSLVNINAAVEHISQKKRELFMIFFYDLMFRISSLNTDSKLNHSQIK